MPHVFVVPPEEDESPAWCCFDAENPSRPQSREILEQPVVMDIDTLCDAEDPFYRDPDSNFPELSVTGESSPETMSIVDALLKDEAHSDYLSDSESEYENDPAIDEDRTETGYGHRQSRRTLRDVANDSDVIEVVKVSRKKCPSQEAISNSQDSQQPTGVKRSATLKNRASKVFKSIRGTLRSKSRPRETPSSVSPVPPVPPVPQLPQTQGSTESSATEPTLTSPPQPATLTRRGSRILSQLFTGPSLKTRTSVASMETTKSPTSPTFSSPHLIHDMHPQPIISPPPSLHDDHATEQHNTLSRATSPTPTATSSRSNGRFSKLAIHRMFSFSSRSAPLVAPTRVTVNLDDIPDASPPPPDDIPESTPPTPDYSAPPASVPVVLDDEPPHSMPTRAESCTPPSVVSSTSTTTTSGPQTPTSSAEVAPSHFEEERNPTAFSTFGNLDSEAFKWNSQLNLGLGLGLDLDLTPIVEVQQKNPRPSFSSLSSMGSWKSLTGKRSGESAQPRQSQTFGIDEEADTSLEMRLDSFHFDEMSFDADQFTLASAR